jgi:hypothetical protein
MKNASTGTASPLDRTDWPRVRAMTDAEIVHDADSPCTTAADWEGAVLKQDGVVVGQVKTWGPNR